MYRGFLVIKDIRGIRVSGVYLGYQGVRVSGVLGVSYM